MKNASKSESEIVVVRLVFVIVSIVCAWSPDARAFPELIRHGYVNCNNCHASPSGGGALNDYGRTFSGEGLSTWFRPGEESLFHGAVPRKKIPKWLSVGGDIRYLQLWMETSTAQTARTVFMQADVETAIKVRRFTFDVAFGRFQKSAEEPRPKSRRFFAMYNFTDETSLRVGRFTPVYGINLADHIVATRRPLGLDQGNETYNVEASWLTDTWNFIATAIRGPVELPDAQQENALAIQVARAFKDTYKIGASAWNGRSDQQTRTMAGVHALFGFSPEFYYMGEIDLKWTTNLAQDNRKRGLYSYNRLGYEVYRGIHLLGTFENWNDDLGNDQGRNDRYGAGVQFFPRPHFDIQALWTKYRIGAAGDTLNDYAWATMHYYF